MLTIRQFRADNPTLWPLSQGELAGIRESFVDRMFDGDPPTVMGPAGDREALVDRVLHGGFPEAVARSTADARDAWFRSYVETIVQRDIRELARIQRLAELPDLLTAVAGRLGGLLSFSGLSRDLRISDASVRRYLTLFETLYLVVRIPAWLPSLRQRLIKAPKAYVVDAGLAGHLLGVDKRRLLRDPDLLGGLLESFVVLEIVKQLGWSSTAARPYHWRTAGGREADLILEDRAGRIVALEVKASTRFRERDIAALAELRGALGDRFVGGAILYGGERTLPLGPRLHAIPIPSLWS